MTGPITRRLTVERLQTPTGPMRVVSNEAGELLAVDWDDHADRMHELLDRYRRAAPGGNAEPIVVEPPPSGSPPSVAVQALMKYFDGDLHAIDALRTAVFGTAFQRAVWAALRTIPARSTMSYGELAAKIGKPGAMRAVGLANGSNPVAIVVPCHRVIGSKGALTGYGGGLERKRWLLAHEAQGRDLLR
ncbi:MAG TPA: methylated-DNA--[protein]-cysteine S-methyltransferase [Burkholderiaceae bacterium]|nr:methylated-DNA--[protein]-cysteine S-methyltransferase [Burkholderiaceae bacterium]